LERFRFQAGYFRLEVDLDLTSKVTGIFGPSGAGKTTLLELIAGLRKPSDGVLKLNGKVIVDRRARRWIPPEQRQIGYVPQDLALFPHLTVRENLRYGERGDASELEHITSQFQLEPLLRRFPTHLSGGEKQRVAIGRALMSKPTLLMLDEPLSNLDDDLKARGMDLFQKVRTEFNTPMLYVTHNADEIVALCDQVVVLQNGTVTGIGVPAQFFKASNEPHHIFNSERP
jgi:molybdate transport system ATP-binding protein